MKHILWMTLCLLVLSFPVMADEVQTVENLLKERTEAVLEILQDSSLSEEVKKDQIMNIVGPIIDFGLMAKLTLGKANWGRFNEKQRIEFVDLFVNRLENSYLDQSSIYCCVDVSYKPAFKEGNKVYVPIEVQAKDKPYEILYKFYSSKEGWQAYDVEVNGVSLIRSYQSQFSEVLKNGTPEDLLINLRKQVEESS